MAEGVLFNIAEKILISAGHQALKEVASYWGARGDLKKLADTLELIKARVRDAESRHEESGNTTIKEWLLRLRHVLYQADDLFDDVLTVDRQKQRMEGNRIINQLGLMFSRSGPLLFNRKMAHEIKRIRQELDAIKSDMAGLNLKEVHEPRPAMTRLMNERETTAFVRENDVIGREDDKNNIIDMLFDSQYAEECVSVIPIVGLGGLGKTTLAQLVLSDERVKKEFQIAKWACVPDVNNQKEVLGKICKAFTDQSYVDLSLDQLKSRISESINNKKYLLVLDDIWDNSHSRWLDLKVLLECGGRGSKIIVTTRSSEIAGHVGNPYNLGLLKKVESWRLFQSLAFRPGQEESNRNLTKIGEEIVKNCGNLPLALRMVGSLLYCKSEDEWEMFRNRQVLKAKLTEDGNVVPVLKLSYDYLEPALKQCFAYCSLFPEDYEFDKVELVRLWMAQGYVDPINEEEGDRCFLELLRRNFFQDVKEDVERSSMRCKMHDLVHDLAKQVAGFENMLVDKCGVLFNDRSLHISVVSGTLLSRDLQPLLAAVKMRSLLLHKEYTYSGSDDENKERLSVGLISRFQSLRSLSLRGLKIKVLPKSIGRLRHLRYLNLSGNSIEALPEDITRLENLQSLDLSQCELLRELPRCFTKLTCLRHLAIKGCSKITEMPSELEKMKSLRELSNFIVGELNGLDALGGLNLRGRLIIRCNIWRRDMLLEAQGMNLKAKQHLTSLSLDLGLSIEETYDDSLPSRADVEMCMKHLLLLPPNLRFLEVNGYRGGRFPVGMVADLHKLVEIQIEDCRSCRSLPLLSHLPLLKRLSLWGLGALEYIEDEQSMSGSNADREFFPSLEFLYLDYLKELKGWSRVEKKERLCFPRLSKIIIGDCPKMMSMPQLPRLVSLDADNIREKLLMNSILGWQQEAHDSPPLLIHCLYIRSISGLVSLPLDFCNVDTLKIFKCQELRELILGYPNSPKKLTISGCERLRNTSQGLQHLSVIEKLRIRDYEDLDVWDVEDNEEGESRVEENKIRGWQALKSLRDLKLMYISNLEMLPRGIAYLQTLQRLDVYELPNLRDMSEHIGQLCQLRELEIWECPKLACLPQSIRGLTSLRELMIIGCPLLEERCERPDGQDWPLIHHIPNVSVKVNYYY